MTNNKLLKRTIAIFLLTLIGCIIVPYEGSAQGFYVTADLGKNYSGGGHYLGFTLSNPNTVGVYGSYGEGTAWEMGVGYMFNDNIGIEGSFSRLTGIEFEHYNISFSQIDFSSGKISRITSELKVCYGKKFNPYAKIGIVFGIKPELNILYDHTLYQNGSTVVKSNEKYSGGSATGFSGTIGMEIKIYEHFEIYGEAKFINQIWRPNEYVILSETVTNGTTSTFSTTFKLVDEIDNLTQTNQRLKPSFPFNSMGFFLGIKVNLWKSGTKGE